MPRRPSKPSSTPGGPAPPGSLAHFQQEVAAITQELNRRIPILGRAYSPAALVVSLVLQLEAVLKATLGSGDLTRHEADILLGRLERAVAAY
jgi:hypothetical protein